MVKNILVPSSLHAYCTISVFWRNNAFNSTNKLIKEKFTSISTLTGRVMHNKDQLVNVVPSFQTPAKAVLIYRHFSRWQHALL